VGYGNPYSVGTTKPIKSFCPPDSRATGIFFTKDRTETCITPLGEEESIVINSFIPLENPDFYNTKGGISYFNPVPLYKAIINSRYLFTDSEEEIIITSGVFISGNFVTGGAGKLPDTFTKNQFENSIKLDNDKMNLIIDKPLNNYVLFDFKFKITIKQEDKTISVILEFTKDSSDQRIQTPRCIVNSNYGKCINYIGGFIP
jgi:hypothetical protein